MNLYEVIFLGIVQGITEWLPISSEGLITYIATLGLGQTFREAVSLAIWLHLGTACAALFSFYRYILKMLKDLVKTSAGLSDLSLLLIAVLSSGIVGFPLLVLVREVQISTGMGDMTMIIIGIFTIISGFIQRSHWITAPKIIKGQPSIADALYVGIAQGLAVVPGLSRSGLTVTVLLLRGIEQRRALTFSYVMSIPVAVAAAGYIGITDGLFLSSANIISGVVAFIFGLSTIRIVLVLATRVNVSKLLIVIGFVMVLTAIPFLLAGIS